MSPAGAPALAVAPTPSDDRTDEITLEPTDAAEHDHDATHPRASGEGEGMDPLARELLKHVREHGAEALTINREGFDAIVGELKGMRADVASALQASATSGNRPLLVIGGIVVVALVVIGAIAGAQINAHAFGATVGTAPISGQATPTSSDDQTP